MAEEATQQQQQQSPPQGDPAGGASQQQGDPAGGDGGTQQSGGRTAEQELEATRRALKAANREAEQHRAKLKEFEDRDKSDLDKAIERATAAEQRAAQLERDTLRFKVATAKGLPAAMAARLQGDTEDELAADADTLLSLIGTNGNSNGQQQRPDLGQGARGGTMTPQGQPPATASEGERWLRGAAARRR